MVMKYRLSDGKEIGAGEIYEIHKYYESASAAEYFQSLYPDFPDKIAFEIGEEIRRLMDKEPTASMDDTIYCTVVPKIKSKVFEWVSEHEVAAEDFERSFGINLSDGEDFRIVTLTSAIAWIWKHEQLWKDFINHFSKVSII